ncbi:VENN motif pre-toxin domain-containing protein [Snodgrassella sp.]|uniref:VENN motif pre-toxin domain-containing protein n=1 Tax=Snodgrassella sp. TaxID=2815304 RepID=UPI002585B9C9|nr:VENN motif pre-toxin domain-containing protein [Snodgrassella sp.]
MVVWKGCEDLTADEKATVSAIAGLTGAATGAAVGDNMADEAQRYQAAYSAVNNHFKISKTIKKWIIWALL